MKRAIFLGLALILVSVPPTIAATKAPVAPITIINLAPTLSTNFSGGDEVSALIGAPTGIFLIGTLETATSQLVLTPQLGGSDGFISELAPSGARLWDLRLGTAGDDVATAGYVDALGNIWIAGASAISTGGGVPAPGLKRLTVWEVSATGALLNTFTKDLPDVDIASSITLKGANFIIQGSSSKAGNPSFAVSLTPLGKLGTIKNSVIKPASATQIFSATSFAYGWLSYVTPKAISGVLGMSSRQSTTVLIKSGVKDKALKSIYSVQGAPLSLLYQSGVGVIELTQSAGSYLVTIIHTK